MGIATEAHLIGLSYGFEVLKLASILFGTDGKNSRMRGFFEKMGIKLVSVGGVDDFPNSHNYRVGIEDWPIVKANLIQAFTTMHSIRKTD